MATYVELFNLRSDSELRNRIAVACVVAAETIRTEDDQTPNHADRVAWSAAVLLDPVRQAERMLWLLLASSKEATVEQIRAVSDSVIQSAVDSAVNLFAIGS
jgi:hypothetical protein